MVEKFLSVNATTSHQNNVGDTALHWACYRGDETSVAALLQHGADFEIRGDIGNRPLHLAATSGNTKVVFTLVVAGARVNSLNDYGKTNRTHQEKKKTKANNNNTWHLTKSFRIFRFFRICPCCG